MNNGDGSKKERPQCEHEEFLGRPIGYVPTSWECCGCGLVMTPGELVIYNTMRDIHKMMKRQDLLI